MLDHMLITRNLLAGCRDSQIHNEVLHHESPAFVDGRKYPESDHVPSWPSSTLTWAAFRRPTTVNKSEAVQSLALALRHVFTTIDFFN